MGRPDRLVAKFTLPLQGAGVDCARIRNEFESRTQYAIQLISLSTLEYRSVGGDCITRHRLQSSLTFWPWLSCCCHYQHPMENWNVHSHK